MAVSNPPSVVSFDVELLQSIIEETIEGTLRSMVEYNAQEFNPLYVDEVTLAFYDDEAQMQAHFERIHSYVHIDFTEINLFTESLFPPTERVRFLATGFDLFTLLRVYVDDEGVFLALDPDEPVEPLVAAIEDALDPAAGT